jgi:hypothetical protein
MATPPQPAPLGPGPTPPPPPELCTNCQLPGGSFIITTVADCQSRGGTPVGAPFPCSESDLQSQQLKEQEKSA